ncbi:MAG TPA: alpha/beta fold hydrolase [Longimicrobium sp.]|nr:alpha/beta fold hydrolase [Longimicrobium sp.]
MRKDLPTTGWRRRVAFLSTALLLGLGGAAGAVSLDQRAGEAPAGDDRELVVLVHGMGRTRASMWWMGQSLERRGYRVVNWGYSSYTDSVPALGEALARDVERDLGGAPRVHFVGHSLGNVIVRWMLANDAPGRVGRVVMLAPPNQGSAAADRWSPYLSRVMPPIAELRTSGSTVRALPAAPAGVEVGVIAGARDGKVSVDETRLPGARAHVVVPAAHTFIMDRPGVHRLTARFLRTGSFEPGE